MSINFVGVGSGVAGVNTSITPGAPTGIAVGHLVIIMASIRNSGAGSPNTPTGWVRLNPASNVAFFGRFWQSGDVMPTITFTGGVANADTLAQAIAFSGAETTLASIAVTELLNASAQNIAYPAATVASPQQLTIIAGWKQDDNTGVTTPAGFTSGFSQSTATGDDASQAFFYRVTGIYSNIAASSLTVTGGAAAISRGFVITVRRDAIITLSPQNSWPPRVQIQISPLAIGDSVAFYRVVGGVRTLLRPGLMTLTDVLAINLDAELPFGVPVKYEVDVNGLATWSSSTATYTLPGGKNAITDAITGLAAEVVIQEWTSKRRDRRASVFRTADGRNVVVSGALGGFSSTVTLYTTSTSSAENLISVLEDATSGTVQIRQGTGATGVDAYVAVTGYEEERYDESTGEDEKRLWRLDVVEVEPWALSLASLGYTYSDLATVYAGLAYFNLQADYATYAQLRQADLS